MEINSIQVAKEHWGRILSCDPSKILADEATVTRWDHDSIEFLVWEGGAIVGVPDRLSAKLREQINRIPFELSCEDARQLVTPLADIDAVLGPQFVGYCDRMTFNPVEREARPIEPSQLQPLRDSCPENEWARSDIQITRQDRPTFAVLTDEQPIAASQISSAHGVAGFGTITHPEYRNRGHGKAVVSRAMKAAFDQDLLPEYRTVEHWSSSVALAEDLGFEQVARSILVQLPEAQ